VFPMSSTRTRGDFTHDEQSFLRSFPSPLIATNVKGAYVIPAPSTVFDSSTASADELIKNGVFWPRPSATDHPSLRRAWQRVYSQKRQIEWIAPKLEPQAGKTHILRKPAKQVANANFVTNSWSGAGIRNGGPWNRVVGQWFIPTVSQPSEAQGTEGGWNSSSWLGIDGFLTTSNDVLQAGVEQKVDGQGNASYVAWFEWFAPQQPTGSPAYINQINVPSLAVSPGQLVFCLVNYFGPIPPFGNFGNIVFLNMSTNQAFAVLLVPPPGATATGDTIEWIMEAPDGGEPTSSLPQFTPVPFLMALGSTRTATNVGNPANGDTVNIEDSNGKDLTSVTVADAIVVIDFIG
jgi:hypothetical protein